MRFSSQGDGIYYYHPRSEEERAFLRSSTLMASGEIWEEPKSNAPEFPIAGEGEKEVVETVENCKQALDWLVEHKGVKRGVMSREQIVALGAECGVEFPNLKKK